MSPSEIANAVRWRLASDIETEVASQGRVAERIADLRSRLDSQPEDWILAAAMAFEIERWYTAVESLFVRILRTLEGDGLTAFAFGELSRRSRQARVFAFLGAVFAFLGAVFAFLGAVFATFFFAGPLDAAFTGCVPAFRRTISAIQTGA
jgi:hypothetical protein